MWPRQITAVGLAIGCASSVLAAAQKPAVADILKVAGDYLLQYGEKLSTVAAEEEYTQRDLDVRQGSRRLRSDFVLIGHKGGSISTFRDVFEVDGSAVRQRDDRLLKVFDTVMVSAAHGEASTWTEEAARYYLSPNLRLLDLPTTALEFLRPVNQDACDFSVERVRNENGKQVATLTFKARTTEGVLATPEGAITEGRVWVEVSTGTIRQTELLVHGKGYSFRTTTKYAHEPALDLWLPTELVQLLDLSSAAGGFSNMGAGGHLGARQSLEGRARYMRFRRPTRKGDSHLFAK
jgi:hypothetical protein